jgi:hypothetical protein
MPKFLIATSAVLFILAYSGSPSLGQSISPGKYARTDTTENTAGGDAGEKTSSQEMCVDAKRDLDAMIMLVLNDERTNCTLAQVYPPNDGYGFVAACTAGGKNARVSGRIWILDKDSIRVDSVFAFEGQQQTNISSTKMKRIGGC